MVEGLVPQLCHGDVQAAIGQHAEPLPRQLSIVLCPRNGCRGHTGRRGAVKASVCVESSDSVLWLQLEDSAQGWGGREGRRGRE